MTPPSGQRAHARSRPPSGRSRRARRRGQDEIGPPSQSYGCCTVVGLPGSPDRIGSLPGNKSSADCSYYIDNQITVTVPIWDTAGGTGQNAWYHIVGFAGFQITACEGGKDIEGVWRKAFFTGPTTSTPSTPGVPEPLGVQLVRSRTATRTSEEPDVDRIRLSLVCRPPAPTAARS